jgi:arginyl-tRNA synthetase
MDELTEKLTALGLRVKMSCYPNSSPEVNPIDIYRSHITDLLQQVTGVDPKIIYPALTWTSTLDKGDLTLAVPALRVKGKKPPELAAEWAEKV